MLYGTTNRFLLLVVFISAISTFVVADDTPIFPNIPDGCKLSPSYFLEDCAKVLSSGPFFSYECVKASTSGGKFAYTCCDHLEGETFAFSMEDNFFTCQHKFGRRHMEADESVGVADNADLNMEAADVGVADKADIPDFPDVPGGCQFLRSGGVSDDDCNKVMPMTGPFLSYDCEVGYTCCLQDEGETFLVWWSDPSDLYTCTRNAGRRHIEADVVGDADKTDIPDHPVNPSRCQFTGGFGVSDEDCDRQLSIYGDPGFSYDCKDIDGHHIGYICCGHFEGETFVWWMGDKTNLFTCTRNAGRRMEVDVVGVDNDVWLSEGEESSSAGVSAIASAVLTGAVAVLLY